jgi:hypothetical protein
MTTTGKTTKARTTATKRAARAVKPAARRPRTRTAAATAGAGVTYEQIAMRAYEIHLSGTGGDALEHWLRAERELAAA